jgi:hypothetical protein
VAYITNESGPSKKSSDLHFTTEGEGKLAWVSFLIYVCDWTQNSWWQPPLLGKFHFFDCVEVRLDSMACIVVEFSLNPIQTGWNTRFYFTIAQKNCKLALYFMLGWFWSWREWGKGIAPKSVEFPRTFLTCITHAFYCCDMHTCSWVGLALHFFSTNTIIPEVKFGC